MDITLPEELTDRIAGLLTEITATEAARMPLADEVRAEVERVDALALRTQASGSFWPGAPTFSASVFDDAVLAALVTIEPDKARKLVADRAKRRGELWHGLRLAPAEKTKRLDRLRSDLRLARAKLEQRRREIEEQTGEVMPRVNDDPAIWLMVPDALNELANGRAAR